MVDSLPDLAQRVTVLGSTRNSLATSAGVRSRSSSPSSLVTALMLYPSRQSHKRPQKALAMA